MDSHTSVQQKRIIPSIHLSPCLFLDNRRLATLASQTRLLYTQITGEIYRYEIYARKIWNLVSGTKIIQNVSLCKERLSWTQESIKQIYFNRTIYADIRPPNGLIGPSQAKYFLLLCAERRDFRKVWIIVSYKIEYPNYLLLSARKINII